MPTKSIMNYFWRQPLNGLLISCDISLKEASMEIQGLEAHDPSNGIAQ